MGKNKDIRNISVYVGLLILLVLTLLSSFSDGPTSDDPVQEVAQWYKANLQEVMLETHSLEKLLANGCTQQQAKDQFVKIRQAYKWISFLTDHLNTYETQLMNSAALARAEEDNPNQVVPPQGMQYIEEILWNQWLPALAARETSKLIEVLKRLDQERDYQYKFRPRALWQSIREGLISVMAKGIAGADAPLSGNGLQESAASLRGMANLLQNWQQITPPTHKELFTSLSRQMNQAAQSLDNAGAFNSFDRYAFLKKIMNPLYKACATTISQLGLQPVEALYAVNPEAPSLFDETALNIAFFSPNARYLPTPQRIALGKRLFFDTRLSGNGQRSCATCHRSEYAFAEPLPRALAMDENTPLMRNTPTLLNVTYQTRQFYDSRMATLEFQVNDVVHNQLEMGGSIEKTVEIIKREPDMSRLFAEAYAEEKEAVNKFTVANALGSFMRSLFSLNSRFDKAMRNQDSFSPQEQHGFNLFMGKAKCGTCHFLPLFNGLAPPRFSETESEVLGVPARTGRKAALDADSGKYLFTRSVVHQFAFKTPTLRNVTLTAPYMHNGVFGTLEEVIDFYDKGGGSGMGISLPNQSLPFDRLNLSKQEKKNLIRFLHTLTDTSALREFGR